MPRCLECGAKDPRWLKTTRVWECRHCGHQQADPTAPAMAGDSPAEGDADEDMQAR